MAGYDRLLMIQIEEWKDFVHELSPTAVCDSSHQYAYIGRIKQPPTGGTATCISVCKIDLTGSMSLVAYKENEFGGTLACQLQSLILDEADSLLYGTYDRASGLDSHICAWNTSDLTRKTSSGDANKDYTWTAGALFSQGACMITENSEKWIYSIHGMNLVTCQTCIKKHRASSDSTLIFTACNTFWHTANTGVKPNIMGLIKQDPYTSGASCQLYLGGAGQDANSRLGMLVKVPHPAINSMSLSGAKVAYLSPDGTNQPYWGTVGSFIDMNCCIWDFNWKDTDTIWAVGGIPKAGQTGISSGDQTKTRDGLILRIWTGNTSGDYQILGAWRVKHSEAWQFSETLGTCFITSGTLYAGHCVLLHDNLGDNWDRNVRMITSSGTCYHQRGYVFKFDITSTTPSLTWARGLDDSTNASITNVCKISVSSAGEIFAFGDTSIENELRDAFVWRIPADPTYPTGTKYDGARYKVSADTSYFTIEAIANSASLIAYAVTSLAPILVTDGADTLGIAMDWQTPSDYTLYNQDIYTDSLSIRLTPSDDATDASTSLVSGGTLVDMADGTKTYQYASYRRNQFVTCHLRNATKNTEKRSTWKVSKPDHALGTITNVRLCATLAYDGLYYPVYPERQADFFMGLENASSWWMTEVFASSGTPAPPLDHTTHMYLLDYPTRPWSGTWQWDDIDNLHPSVYIKVQSTTYYSLGVVDDVWLEVTYTPELTKYVKNAQMYHYRLRRR